MVRLLQSGLIEPHDLARKYASELHASEILLLAYYIACVNIEQTYAEQIATIDATRGPEPFNGLILTDTFQSWEPHDTIDTSLFVENNERLQRLKDLDITVIVGNPPYSVGQESANDNNANEKYPSLDEHIRATYVERSSAALSRNMYDRPRCQQPGMALGADSPSAECLFCLWNPNGEEAAQEYVSVVLGLSSYVVIKDGGEWPVYSCMECGAEALVDGIHVVTLSGSGSATIATEPSWACFECAYVASADHFSWCTHCGGVMGNDPDVMSVCADLLREHRRWTGLKPRR